ncbi:YHYH domain-containing protein [Pseudomonas sp. Irchel 3E13]|nr:YHYH domain-containing protein [Pseudomonas sp. Irchel 3E13]
MKVISLVIATVLSLSSVSVFAHSGGTDSKGCHTNHKTGERHCH